MIDSSLYRDDLGGRGHGKFTRVFREGTHILLWKNNTKQNWLIINELHNVSFGDVNLRDSLGFRSLTVAKCVVL